MLATVLEAASKQLYSPSMDEVGVLDACWQTRPPKGSGSYGVTPHLVMLAFLAGVLIHYEPPVPKGLKNNSFKPTRLFFAFQLALAYAWYVGSVHAVTYVKELLGDHTCNVHANSVSGHYNFFSFMIPTLYSIYQQMTTLKMVLRYPAETNTRFPTFLFSKWSFPVLYGFFVLMSLFTMLETYFYGYHSLRQVLYGLAFGVLSHMLFDLIRKRTCWFTDRDYAAEMQRLEAVIYTVAFQIFAVCLLFVELGIDNQSDRELVTDSEMVAMAVLDFAVFALYLALLPAVQKAKAEDVTFRPDDSDVKSR